LIDAGKIDYLQLDYSMSHGSINANRVINLKRGNQIIIEELDREFIFIFALSTLSRYRVNEWDKTISGKSNNLISKIRRYLQAVQLVFPNLILNQLYGRILSFYSPARAGTLGD
jgi:hypothetical protein